MIVSRTRLVRFAVSAVGALAVSAIVPVPAAGALRDVPAVYALDAHGHLLLPRATLTPGEHVTVVGTGFRRGASVQVIDVLRRAQTSVRADAGGVAKAKFDVPIGGAAAGVVDLAGPVAGSGGHGAGRGTVVVAVPLIRTFPFAVHTGRGVDAVHTGQRIPDTASSGDLAATGVDLLAFVLLGAALVAAGALLQVSRRRRLTS